MIAAILFAALLSQDNPADKLPEGEGKKVVVKICLDCHGPENFIDKRLDKAGWEAVISDMIEKGATAKDEEFDQIVAYLTKYFGKQQKR